MQNLPGTVSTWVLVHRACVISSSWEATVQKIAWNYIFIIILKCGFYRRVEHALCANIFSWVGPPVYVFCSTDANGSSTFEAECGCALCGTQSYVVGRGRQISSYTWPLWPTDVNVQDGEEECISEPQGTIYSSLVVYVSTLNCSDCLRLILIVDVGHAMPLKVEVRKLSYFPYISNYCVMRIPSIKLARAMCRFQHSTSVPWAIP